MRAALYRKELYQLAPWALGMGVLVIGAHVAELFSRPPDEFRWVSLTTLFSSGDAPDWGIVLAAFCFAYSGFPREHDDQTLPFLFSLPISRARLFLSKWLAAWTLLALLVSADELCNWLLQLPNHTSFGQTFQPSWVFASLFTRAVTAWVLLGHAFFLSVFRRFGLLVGALEYWFLDWLVKAQPSWRRLSPLDLRRVEFHGSAPLVPWRVLAAHTLVALLLASIAGWVWVGSRDRLAADFSRWLRRPLAQVCFALGVLGAIGFAVRPATQADTPAPAQFGTVIGFDSPEARLDTARYTFRYPSSLRDRVTRLAARADEQFDALARELGLAPKDERVEVNLTQPSATHAGTTTWETIRMDPRGAADPEEFTRTLVHESVHVLALRASQRSIFTHDAAFGVFHEGLADYLAFEHVPSEPRLNALHFGAVLLAQRAGIVFRQLLAHEDLESRFGSNAQYPLGHVLVEALITTCGSAAPRRVLETLAKPDTPREAPALGLWQHVLQAQGCDLSRVDAAWSAAIDRYAQGLGEVLGRVPNIVGGALSTAGERLLLRAELDRDPIDSSADYQVVLRTGPSGSEKYYPFPGTLEGTRSLTFSIVDPSRGASPIDYQLVSAWRHAGAFVYLRSPWRKTSALPRP